MKKILLINIVVLLVLFNVIHLFGKEQDPFPEIVLPIYPGAYSVEEGVNIDSKFKYVRYKISMEFPKLDVLEYYDKEFGKRNYDKYFQDGYGSRHWERFNKRSGEFEKNNEVPGRLLATWINHEKDKRFVLRLTYENNDNQDGEIKNLTVECKVCSFFDLKALDKFYQKIENEGKKDDFDRLLKKYEGKGNKIDIKRAIKENPNNQLLKEFDEATRLISN